MVVISGIDMVEISRVRTACERWGERFLRRIFTPRELAACGGRARSLAARWAAKEAAAKALGIGLRGLGHPREAVGWQELEVISGAQGQPGLLLHGAAAARAAELGISELSLSLTHTGDVAAAVVVGVGEGVGAHRGNPA